MGGVDGMGGGGGGVGGGGGGCFKKSENLEPSLSC